MKTNKATKKRFKVKKANVYRKKSNAQHLLRNKSKNQLVRLKKQQSISDTSKRSIKKLIIF